MIYSEPEYNKMDEIEFRRKALQDSLDAGKTQRSVIYWVSSRLHSHSHVILCYIYVD